MNLQTFDLNLLVAFEALMIEKSVTRAARRVGLSQPAMSNALARLRRTFNDPLLVRTIDGMTPTPRAQSLIGPVRASLTQLRAALEQRPAFEPRASRRTFRMLTSDYVEITLIGPLIKALRDQSSGITIRLSRPANLFQSPTPASLSDSYDLALGFFPDALTLDASLRSEQLWEENNACIASASHPVIKGKITMKQYAAAHHAAVFYKSEGPGVIDTLLAQKGLTRRAVALVPHFASIFFIVSATDLIATVPEHLAREFSKQLKLQVLPAPLALPPFRLSMLWHESLDPEPAHAWLRAVVSKTAASLAGKRR
jgi:DNA-binding transcriptional LysR family regulator